jgi:hypothetical protein
VAATDLRPRTVGELLDAAFFVYRSQFARLLLVAVVVSLPGVLSATLLAEDASAASAAFLDKTLENMSRRDGDFVASFQRSLEANALIQPYLLLSSVMQAFARSAGIVTMSFVAAAALRRARAPGLGALLRASAPRIPAAFLTQILIDNVTGICLPCCPPVGICLLALFGCTVVAIAEGPGPMEGALRRALPAWIAWIPQPFVAALDGVVRSVHLSANAHALMRGMGFFSLLLLFLSVVFGSATAVATLASGSKGAWYWAQSYAEALFLPVWGLGVSLWYADLRARREGADLVAAA